MSRWTSRRAILRDLSLAQGAGFAGVAGGAGDMSMELAACDRPPPRAARREETEEECLRQYASGAGEAEELLQPLQPLKPDLRLIRQMLDMVRDLNVSEEEVKTNDGAIISKLSPFSSEFVPRSTDCKSKLNTSPEMLPAEETCLPRNTPPPNKQKKQRNAALESILRGLENHQNNSSAETHRALTLLTPRNLITDIQHVKETPIDTQNVESRENSKLAANNITNKETDNKLVNGDEKVKDWMARMTSPVSSQSPRIDTLSLDTTTMFKKRSKASVGSEGTTNGPARSEARESNGCSAEVGCGAYVPSPLADVYYQKYLARSRLRDSMREDIWTEAEKTMRKIDEKKRLETARVSSEAEVVPVPEEELDPLRCVRLSAPRHAPGRGVGCVVCAALLSHPPPSPPPRLPPPPTPPVPPARRTPSRLRPTTLPNEEDPPPHPSGPRSDSIATSSTPRAGGGGHRYIESTE